MVQRLENLEEIVPDGIFRYGAVLFRRLVDDGGKVATAAVFHENVESSSISIDVSVVVLYNVVMMKVLENVSARCRRQSVVKLQELVKTHTSATICFLSRSLILSKLSSLRANICKKDHEPGHTKVQQIARTKPSVFRRTLRIIPKEPVPMTSSGSWLSRNRQAIVVAANSTTT
jgi:hypothetical protein